MKERPPTRKIIEAEWWASKEGRFYKLIFDTINNFLLVEGGLPHSTIHSLMQSALDNLIVTGDQSRILS